MFGMSEEQKAARARRRAEAEAQLLAKKNQRDDLKAYVEEHKRERIATFADLHLFPIGSSAFPASSATR